MEKKLIVGLAGLGIGLAVAGGVGGYFIANSTKEQKEENAVVAQEDFTDYNLPAEFNYVSYTLYDISENFSMFSSSSLGMYLLNKETKEFSFFNSSYISASGAVSDEVNGFKYLWLNNKNLFKINTKTGDYEIVSLNSGVAFTYLYFIGHDGNRIFIKGNGSSNDYYFLVFDTEKYESDVYSITWSSYYDVDLAIDLGDYYFLAKSYNYNKLGYLLIYTQIFLEILK